MSKQTETLLHALDRAAIVVIADPQGNITYVNDNFSQISKYAKEEIIGQNYRAIIASGHVFNGDVCGRAKDGGLYWVHVTIVPNLDDGGNPYQYTAICYDITMLKKTNEQLKEYSQQLELSNRDLQDFASIAAHDLQEPLRKIFTFVDRLKLKEDSDYLERIKSAAQRMRTLIDDLLNYSRLHINSSPFAKIDLNIIVADVLSDLEVKTEELKAKIEVGQLPVIEAEATQMRQLMQNIISNGLKFHKEGEPPSLKIKGDISGDFCEISIQDSGIGFDTKYLDRIFTMFERLHGRQKYEGTGVGLAIARRIVDRHSGSITAESEIGQGARFIMRLPIRQNNSVGAI